MDGEENCRTFKHWLKQWQRSGERNPDRVDSEPQASKVGIFREKKEDPCDASVCVCGGGGCWKMRGGSTSAGSKSEKGLWMLF